MESDETMKIDLLDIDRFIDVNKLQEVTSHKIFSNNITFDPEGPASYEIFGISKGDRAGRFAFIDLRRPFLHPHIYGNVLKRMFNNIVYIVSGQRRYSIKDGRLVEDSENGWTGLASLYENWDNINWNKLNSSNERSIKLLSYLGKNQAFITKIPVCPVMYRDVEPAGTVDFSDRVDPLNKLYSDLISAISLLSEGGLFQRSQNATQYRIQEYLLEISNHFKDLISKKHGLIRKYLMGKTVDFGTRAVISAPTYNHETISESMVGIDYTAVPISHCCSTFYPFIETWLRNFFTREIINDPNLVSFYDSDQKREIIATLKDPELQFSDKAIKKMINDYIFNPDNRFKIMSVDTIIPGTKEDKNVKAVLILKGNRIMPNNARTVLNRAMTVTDILYLACVDVCEKRHIMVTRYPVGTDKGLFMSKIRVQSTRTQIKLIFNGKEYPFYPDIDFNIPQDKIGIQFVDSAVFSNSMLEGLGGDYDGDQVSIRGIWTDEANAEAEEIMNKKMTALSISGANSRFVGKEILTACYALTKIGKGGSAVNQSDTRDYLSTTPDGFTRSKLVSMIATTTDITDKKNTTKRKARHNTWDKFVIPANYFYEDHGEIDTTIGRFIFNKYVLEGSGIIGATKIITDVLDKGGLEKLDGLVGELYMHGIISRAQFNAYIDRRDNLGYWLAGVLSHTISLRMAKPLKEINAKKKELLKKYSEALSKNDITVMAAIEKELIEYAKKILGEDPGMDLYLSGDLDFSNCYKNNSIIKGPVLNKLTNEFDFIGNSFMDGIEIKDLAAHANSILLGQYPASIATKESGYMGKKLLQLLQMMEVDEPGTDCGTKALIPITVTTNNKKDLVYSYFESGGQLQMLTKENIGSYVGQTLNMRSPMSCINPKICSFCAGDLFYKLDIKQIGLFSTQLSHAMLNLALKAKHVSIVGLHQFDPNTILKDV